MKMFHKPRHRGGICKLLFALCIFSIYFSQTTISMQAAENSNRAGAYTELKIHTLTSGSKEDLAKAELQQYATDGETLIPLQLKSNGNLYMEIYSERMGAHPVSLYSHADASDLPIILPCFCSDSNGGMYYGIASRCLTKGTYYMQLPKDNYFLKVFFYNQADRTLTLNKWITAYSDYNNPTYFTYKATESGYLTVQENAIIDTGYSAEVILCNSKKNAIVDSVSNHSIDDKIVYAVKKGTTYKIKVSSTDPNMTQYYRIKATFTKCVEKSGSKKSKATAVAFGKTANGMVLAEDALNKADWYKITNPQKQTVCITYAGSITSGQMKLEIYNSKGKKLANYAVVSRLGESNSYYVIDKNGSTVLPKGTYYFKVTKSRQTACGIYSIKMSKK